MSKPYMDKEGVIWVKSGSDKRRATSREEIQRMYQSAGLLHGDELSVNGLSVSDLDLDYFRRFFEKQYGEPIENQEVPLPKLLENMNLMNDGVLNISGALLFAKTPQFRLPVFIVKAICYPGNDIDLDRYLDSQDIAGKLADVFHQSLSFILGNIKHLQFDQNVNAVGEPEIPRETLEELLANALIHRDYFVSAPVRIFVFSNRVEIISPGHLPNNLTIANIKSGNSNIRNPILASYATKILPYRGLGSGIRRALKAYPDIEFVDDREGNQFKVVIKRSSGLVNE
jgi:ATP-dependent DNA helicase RecG